MHTVFLLLTTYINFDCGEEVLFPVYISMRFEHPLHGPDNHETNLAIRNGLAIIISTGLVIIIITA